MHAKLPDALADALGRVISDTRREARTEIDAIKAMHRAEIAELRADAAETIAGLKAAAEAAASRVNEALARVRDGHDGKDGEPGEPGPAGADADSEMVKALVEEAVAQIPLPKDGKDADPGLVAALIDEKLDAAIAALPPPEKGEKGDRGEKGDLGPAGRGIDWLEIRDGELCVTWSDDQDNMQVLGKVVGPIGERGEKGDSGDPGPEADYDLILRMIEDQVKDLPRAKDGVGLAGALIDRDGELALTLTDGTVKYLGVVVGRDGAPGAPGRDGADGLSIEDLSAEFDGERVLTLRFARGEVVKEIPIEVPIPIDRGVFREGNAYAKGDGVTYGGSWWICQKDAPEGKPDAGNGSWRLAVKHGRDGKDGKGEKGDKGDPGRPGKDFTAGRI